MAMGSQDRKFATIVQGEASESDSEEELNNDFPPTAGPPTSDGPPVLQTSASLQVDAESLGSVENLMPRTVYHTVLHKKLRQTNESLYNGARNCHGDLYLDAAKKLRSCSKDMAAMSRGVRETAHKLQLMTNQLFQLEDEMDKAVAWNENVNISMDPR